MKTLPYEHDPDHMPPHLAEIPFFRALHKEEIDTILSKATVLECERGEVILIDGAVDHALHILLKGQVHVMKAGQPVAGIGRPGELLGEMALLADGHHTATVVAAADSTYCLRVDATSLEDLPFERRHAYHAELYLFLARLMERRLQATTEKLAASEQLAQDYRRRLEAAEN
jgi:CRP-like cAMP-binding protein